MKKWIKFVDQAIKVVISSCCLVYPQELLLPLTVTAESLDKLRRWEEPHLTAAFLAFAYAVILRYNDLHCSCLRVERYSKHHSSSYSFLVSHKTNPLRG